MRCIDADALIELWKGCTFEGDITPIIENAPTIEPERKKGKWVELGENPDGTHNICCGFCGVGKYKSKGHANSEYTKQRFKFCPNCGAEMREGGQE